MLSGEVGFYSFHFLETLQAFFFFKKLRNCNGVGWGGVGGGINWQNHGSSALKFSPMAKQVEIRLKDSQNMLYLLAANCESDLFCSSARGQNEK